jgi:DNA-3-methyladenine glycosylase
LLAGAPNVAARALLGSIISTRLNGRAVSIRLNEVEAYGGADDPASHAYRSQTVRNAPMWGPPGTVYVYLSYGIHWCANIVTGPEGSPSAVLLRGGEVVEGIDAAVERRGRSDHLADGPGKLSQALGLDGSASGTLLADGPLTIGPPYGSVRQIASTPRIGISRATDVPWRFVEQNRMNVSSSTIP